MKIKLMVVGKTNRSDLTDWIDNYIKRIRRYMPFEWVVVRDATKIKKESTL
jgi:23S rRNA pseudoU1915 N3-methylase RlmH